MRYYLDTNTLVFAIYEREKLSTDVEAIINDYGNILYTSSECVRELIHLVQIGKVGNDKRHNLTASDILPMLDKAGIDVIYINRKHMEEYIRLPLYDDHRDPSDRLIIAQSISDRIPLISSDRKFARYERHGLLFVYNER